jgi:Domain of unknown function (DUF4468) with TBP-like fold
MKKLVLIFCAMCVVASYAQTSVPDSVFVFNTSGLTDFVVKKVSNKTKDEMYKRTLDWINNNSKKPKDVIVSQADGERIVFEGTKSCYFVTNYGGVKRCTDGKYQFEISFKDGKYKLDVLNFSNFVSSTQYSAAGWRKIPLTKAEDLFDANGKLKLFSVDNYKAIVDLCNSINRDIFLALSSSAIPVNKDNW